MCFFSYEIFLFFLVNLSTNLSNLILNNNYSEISLMLNRRTLNNDEILNRILEEYDFKIPGKFENILFIYFLNLIYLDELIGLLLTSIRHDLISRLRTALLSHNDNPCKRLQIHKMIFNVQQVDSL